VLLGSRFGTHANRRPSFTILDRPETFGNELAQIRPGMTVRDGDLDTRTGETIVSNQSLHPYLLKIAVFARQLAIQVLVSMAAATCVGAITGASVETPSPARVMPRWLQPALPTPMVLPPVAGSGKIIDRPASEPNRRVGETLTICDWQRGYRGGSTGDTLESVAAASCVPATKRLSDIVSSH
jgi:hypothetical protein